MGRLKARKVFKMVMVLIAIGILFASCSTPGMVSNEYRIRMVDHCPAYR